MNHTGIYVPLPQMEGSGRKDNWLGVANRKHWGFCLRMPEKAIEMKKIAGEKGAFFPTAQTAEASEGFMLLRGALGPGRMLCLMGTVPRSHGVCCRGEVFG